MCAGYEDAGEMVGMYMGNPQFMAQIEPSVLEDQAVDWLLENGKEKAKRRSQLRNTCSQDGARNSGERIHARLTDLDAGHFEHEQHH